MKLATLFHENHVLIHTDAPDYETAVRQLVDAVASDFARVTADSVFDRLIETERELALPPGHGVRIPHARMGGVDREILALGTSADGIPVDPAAKSPEVVHLIFLILTPRSDSTAMMQTMASVARLVSNEENRKALVSTKSASRALRIIEETGIEVKKAIVASDLMSSPTHTVGPEQTVRDVVAALAACGEEGVPVVGEGGELLGDVSTRIVLEIGLPKYMNLITNPELLSDFEPFESYYRREDTLTADEVMNREVLRLKPETPVEILAHEMIAKQCERAYVVRDKKLVGVVYRKDVVRKVLYL